MTVAITPWHPEVSSGLWAEQVESTGSFGDLARGTGISARFVRDDLPGSMVTVSYWPQCMEDYDDLPAYYVAGQIEYLICTDPADPGGTEVWSDIELDDDSDPMIYTDLSACEQGAGRQINRWLADVNTYLNWDGKSR